MANEIEIVIVATDKASRTFAGIGRSLGDVTQRLGRIGIMAAGAALTGITALAGGMALLGTKAVAAGADAEEMLSKLNVTFGDFTEDVAHALEDFADATGRSKFELKGMAADLGAVMKGMGLNKEAAATLSSEFVKLAVDVGSFNNLPSVDVANRFRAALSGEYESLKALGIVINQAMVEQELLNMGIEGGAKAASQAQLVQARYNLIMAATVDAQGDAARTSTSFTNQMVALKAKMNDLKTEIGLRLLPVLTPFLQRFNDLAAEVLPKLTSWFEDRLLPAISEMGDLILELMEGNLDDPFGALANVAFYLAEAFGATKEQAENIFNAIIGLREPFDNISGALSSFINDHVRPFIDKHADDLKAAFIGIGVAIAGAGIIFLLGKIVQVLGLVTSKTGLLLLAVGLLAAAWESDFLGMRTALTEFWDNKGKQIFEDVVAWLSVNVPLAIETLKDWWNNELLPALEAVWEFLSVDMLPIWEALADLFEVTLGLAIDGFLLLWNQNLLPALEDAWAYITGTLIPGVMELIPAFGSVEEIIQGVAEAIGNLTEAIQNFSLPDWLVAAAEGALLPALQEPFTPPPFVEGTGLTPEELGDLGGSIPAPPPPPVNPNTPGLMTPVTINANVSDDVDIEDLAYRVAEVINTRTPQ